MTVKLLNGYSYDFEIWNLDVDFTDDEYFCHSIFICNNQMFTIFHMKYSYVNIIFKRNVDFGTR